MLLVPGLVDFDVLLEEHSLLQIGSQTARVADALPMRLPYLSLLKAFGDALEVLTVHQVFHEGRLDVLVLFELLREAVLLPVLDPFHQLQVLKFLDELSVRHLHFLALLNQLKDSVPGLSCLVSDIVPVLASFFLNLITLNVK